MTGLGHRHDRPVGRCADRRLTSGAVRRPDRAVRPDLRGPAADAQRGRRGTASNRPQFDSCLIDLDIYLTPCLPCPRQGGAAMASTRGRPADGWGDQAVGETLAALRPVDPPALNRTPLEEDVAGLARSALNRVRDDDPAAFDLDRSWFADVSLVVTDAVLA